MANETAINSNDKLLMSGVLAIAITAAALIAGGLLAALTSGHGWPVHHARDVLLTFKFPGDPSRAWHAPMGPAWWYWTTTTVVIVSVGAIALTARKYVKSSQKSGGSYLRRRTDKGFADGGVLRNEASFKAALRSRDVTRPDLSEQDKKNIRREDVGYTLGYNVTGSHEEIVGTWEQSLILVGPSGCGKTARVLVPLLRHHPGPALVTSTKPDIYEWSALARSKRGLVMVLDPEDMLPGATKIRWSPVRGCEDTRTAERRARALIAGASSGGGGGGNQKFFEDSARSMLQALLHAAAIGRDKTIADVRTWAKGSFEEPLLILDRHSDPLVDLAGTLREHSQGAAVTTSGVTRSVDNALACFSHRSVLDLCMPTPSQAFDIERFIEENGTLYLLGRGSANSATAALTTVLAEEILFVAGNKLAPSRPTGRLAPPLLACLDEAPSVAPLPDLPSLLADGRGRGITTIVAMQTFSQADMRWASAESRTIQQAAITTAVFGGLSVDDTQNLSRATGMRQVEHKQVSKSGGANSITSSSREEPVMSAAEIATLPKGYLLVMMGSLPPVVTKVELIFNGPEAQTIVEEERTLKRSRGSLTGEIVPHGYFGA